MCLPNRLRILCSEESQPADHLRTSRIHVLPVFMVQQSGDVGAGGVNGCIEDFRETIAQVEHIVQSAEDSKRALSRTKIRSIVEDRMGRILGSVNVCQAPPSNLPRRD